MSMAVCDPEAFYPLRSLVAGPLSDLRELAEAERFVRTVVLHDEIIMELEPWPYVQESDPKLTEEERNAGGRSEIVAIGPDLTGYDFFSHRVGLGKPETPDITLSSAVIEAVRKFSNAEKGNVYYEAHIQYLQRIVNIVQNGGSALLAGEFGSATIGASTQFPVALFENIDRDWQQLAQEVNAGDLDFRVPPVLSIILTRCARRDAIPTIIKDLRTEWADAQTKVWKLLDRLKNVSNVAEAQEIRQELAAASRLLSLTENEIETHPIRMLWDLIASTIAGAVAGIVVDSLSTGAVAGALEATLRSLPKFTKLGPALFGRGAFDLAKRVRHETMRVEYNSLARLLTYGEKEKMGL
jgi:hypothetical protein